jgi:hypothetical protein
MPQEYTEWDIVERTGWTLDYIRSLSLQDIHDFYQIQDAKIKARSI